MIERIRLKNSTHGTSTLARMDVVEVDGVFRASLARVRANRIKHTLCGDCECCSDAFGLVGRQSHRGKPLIVEVPPKDRFKVSAEVAARLTKPMVAIALYASGETEFSRIAEIIDVNRGTLWRSSEFQKFREYVDMVRQGLGRQQGKDSDDQ